MRVRSEVLTPATVGYAVMLFLSSGFRIPLVPNISLYPLTGEHDHCLISQDFLILLDKEGEFIFASFAVTIKSHSVLPGANVAQLSYNHIDA